MGEVLLNYAEICYELEAITGKDLFNQEVLNSTINKLRARVNMPNLEEIGGAPAINGVVYDDPARTKWEPTNDVPSMLWEIRRERRVELCYENGLRSADLKRWKKLDYLCNQHNPDYRYGAYIVLDDFPSAVKDGIVLTGVISPDAQQACPRGIYCEIREQRATYHNRKTMLNRFLIAKLVYTKAMATHFLKLKNGNLKIKYTYERNKIYIITVIACIGHNSMQG